MKIIEIETTDLDNIYGFRLEDEIEASANRIGNNNKTDLISFNDFFRMETREDIEEYENRDDDNTSSFVYVLRMVPLKNYSVFRMQIHRILL